MAKPRPYRTFGKLLTEGIKQLDRRRLLGPVQEDLAQELGCASSTIYTWRRGEHLPEPKIIKKLAQIFVQRWQADEAWIDRFLEKGEYGPPQAVAKLKEELFGKTVASDRAETGSVKPEQRPAPLRDPTDPLPQPFIQSWQHKAGEAVASVAISDEGEIVVAGTLGKTVLALDYTGRHHWQSSVGNQAWRVAISADGQKIVVGTGSTRPWDMGGRGLFCFDGTGTLQWQVDLGDSVWGLSLSADGETIAVGTDGKQLILLDDQGRRLWHQNVPGFGPYAWVWSTALSADGQTIAAGAADKRVRLFERSGAPLAEHRARGDVFTVAVSASGEVVAAGDNAGYVYWLNRQGTLLWEERLADKVWAVVLSADSTRLLVGAGEKEAHLRTYSRGGNLLWRRYVGGSVSNLAISTTGQYVAAGTRDGGIHIFGHDGAVLRQQRAGKSVRDVAISARGEHIVAGSEDGFVYGFHWITPA